MPKSEFPFNARYSESAIVSSSEEDSPKLNPYEPVINLNEDVFTNLPKKSLLSPSVDPNAGEISPDDTVSSNAFDTFPDDNSVTNPNAAATIFNKRPLSDTPIASTNTSPNLSNNNSEVASAESSPETHASTLNNHVNIPPIKLTKRRGTAFDLPGVTKTVRSPATEFVDDEAGSKLVIVMVGLPARGKSYITNKLTRYLNWLQHECRVFNVGNTRRKDAQASHIGPSSGPLPDSLSKNEHDANFFNPENTETTKIREKWAMDTLDQVLTYLLDGTGSVGIFDATNSTRVRRRKILDKIRERSKHIKVLYLESICSDPTIVQKNIRLKLSGPDYKNMDHELALKDFTERLHNYEKAYQTIEDDEQIQYIKMIDVGKKVVAYNIQGFLASQAIYYLLNFNLNERQIWITRHGESEDNVTGKIGGDSSLTKRGERFSKTLARFIQFEKQRFRKEQVAKYTDLLEKKEVDRVPDEPNFNVWTSMLNRSVETSKYFPNDEFLVKEIRMLNELCAGNCEGLTYEEIQSKYPTEFNARVSDKLRYRYPGIGGESYLDVISRVIPIINEVERTVDHVLLITHRVVARVLLGYFMNLNRDNITSLDIPLHCIYLLEPKPYGVEWNLFEYNEKIDWFEKVPKEALHQKKVKEVEVAFRERKYSVIPTAPPSFRTPSSSTNSIPSISDRIVSSNPLESVNRARGLPVNQQQTQPNYQLKSAIEVDKLAQKLNKIRAPSGPK